MRPVRDWVSSSPRWRPSMTKLVRHWIDGARTGSAGTGGTADIFNPATGEVEGQVILATVEEVDAAVAAAARAFPDWRDTSLVKRTQILFRFRELLDRNRDELAA